MPWPQLDAESLVELGFEIERGGRFFEVKGVPRRLVERMSGRAREVAAIVAAREADHGRRLTDRERAVVALQTRQPKHGEAPLEQSVATWAETAAALGFDPAAAAGLRNGGGFHSSPGHRRAAVAAAIRARDGESLSPGERGALAYECAAGLLRIEEVGPLIESEAASSQP